MLNIICFPRQIKTFEEYCGIVKPSAISIDFEVDPIKIKKKYLHTNTRRDGSKIPIVRKKLRC